MSRSTLKCPEIVFLAEMYQISSQRTDSIQYTEMHIFFIEFPWFDVMRENIIVRSKRLCSLMRLPIFILERQLRAHWLALCRLEDKLFQFPRRWWYWWGRGGQIRSRVFHSACTRLSRIPLCRLCLIQFDFECSLSPWTNCCPTLVIVYART